MVEPTCQFKSMELIKMSQSESIAELAKALAKAQAKMAGAKKESKNPHLQSRYADLASVWEACRGPLTENDLSIVQALDDSGCADNQICVVTTLLHASGEWIQSRLRMVAARTSRQGEQVDPQIVGSAITYARRYSLAAMVGVSPEDDDAESTMQRRTEPSASKSTGNAPGSYKPMTRPEEPNTSSTERNISESQAKTTSTSAENKSSQEMKKEAKNLGNEILKMVHDGLLTSQEVKLYGDIPSVNEAVKTNDIQRLMHARQLLNDYIQNKSQSSTVAMAQ